MDATDASMALQTLVFTKNHIADDIANIIRANSVDRRTITSPKSPRVIKIILGNDGNNKTLSNIYVI